MAAQFRNLVFEGGGVKGLAYVGALGLMEERGYLDSIRRVGGTSGGAINAALFALGYSNAETRKLLKRLDFRSFLDDDWGVVRDLQRLRRDFGWYRGDYFANWIRERVGEKLGNPDASFGDLQYAGCPDLYVYGTNLNTGLAALYSTEHSPAMSIARAVRISMSLPLFFTAVRQARRGSREPDYLVDGGVLNNYPVKLFDRLRYVARGERRAAARYTEYYRPANRRRKRGSDSTYVYNRQTLGFRLDTEEEIIAFRDGRAPRRRSIDDLFDYMRGLVAAYTEAQANQHLHSDDWQRTLYIDTLGVRTTDFDLSDRRKDALVRAGRDGAAAYFRWFNSCNSDPENRCP